jgi:hypothetical protein
VDDSAPRTAGAEEVAAEILRYLSDHPRAADTLEGIVEWWLPRQRLSDSFARVGAAMDLLVGRGIVERWTQRDGQVIYRVHKAGEEDYGRDGRMGK